MAVLIDGTEGYSCVGAYGSVEEGLPGLHANEPDVLLFEIHLPGMLGSEGVKQIKDELPAIQVLMLTINTVRDYIRSICDKLHVHSKSDAVTKTLRGWII